MSFQTKLMTAENHLLKADRLLAPIVIKYRPCNISPHNDYYAELINSIVSQQLSVAAAATIWKRVLEVFDNRLPSVEQIIQVDAKIIRQCGVSNQKIAYMKDLAQHIVDGRLDLEHISTMPNDRLIEQLVSVKGIGEWSAHMFMIFSLGRLDILPVGDLGIKKALMGVYGIESLPDSLTIQKVAAENSWHPYESVASWYLWKSLDNK